MPLVALLAAALSSALPVVTDIDAAREDGELSVRVQTAGKLTAAEAKVEDRLVKFTVAGATLEQFRATFHHHHRYVQAQRLWGGGVSIEVPLGKGVQCEGPLQLEPRETGLVIKMACGHKRTATAPAELAAAAAAVAALTPPAAVATVAPAAAEVAPVAAPKPAAALVAPTAVPAVELPRPASGLARAAASAPLQEAPLQLAAPSAMPAEPTSRLYLVGLALLALTGLALALARRRVSAAPRLLHVLETVNVGPKRSLIVARVGSQTVLLASSEAGLTLLAPVQGDVGGAAEAPALEAQSQRPAMHISVPVQPLGKALGRGLRALFPQRAPAKAAPSFAALFEETAEDQDLLKKLQSGQAAQVQ